MTPEQWREYQWAQLSARVADRDAAAGQVPDMPQPIILVTSRDDQARFEGRELPASARRLAASGETAGWSVVVRWSLIAVPAGWRESSRHKINSVGFLLHTVSVRLAAYGIRAAAVWHDPGGFEHAGMLTTSTGFQDMGIKALTAYVEGA